jgi:membrane associated rhomboid family serine protease
MLTCPHDQTLLRRVEVEGGIAFVCDTCGGRAVMLPLLRRQLEPAISRQLWAQAVRATDHALPCPTCRQPAARVEVTVDALAVVLDVCRPCTCVWFDRDERQLLPDRRPPPHPDAHLPAAARQLLAIEQVKAMAAEAREHDEAMPDLHWTQLTAVLGMPVELHPDERPGRPWLTWSTAAVVAAIGIAGFVWPAVVAALQLVPADLGHAPLSPLTMFFVHANWWHLLGNLWFLILFGDDVEQLLGRKAWLLLVGGATLLGSVAQLLFDPRSEVPCVGASGGISGLVVCYALLLPNAQLGTFLWYRLRPRWVTFSARVGVLVWLGMQSLMAWQQLAGIGYVSALAHLGGVVAGVLVWWALRATPAGQRPDAR